MRWIRRKSARERAVADRLRASSKFYRFLWEIRDDLLGDGFEEELIACYEPRGQEPCPPGQLAMALLLQAYDGLSDARSVDAAENDRRWQLVLGTLGEEQAPFGQGSLVRFRTRVIAHDLDRKLVDRTVELAKKTKRFGWKKLRAALDSSPLQGAGRVEDTWNLIGRAMSRVVHLVARALEVPEETVIDGAKLSVLRGSSVKTALDIDWDDESARNEALLKLLKQVERLEKWVTARVDRAESPPLDEALTLMRRVAEQDTEPDPPSGGVRIAKEVAADRVISVGDAEMRHGRKSKTKRFNGYKRHIAVANQLILGTAVEPANVRELAPTGRLLRAIESHGAIEALDIDRGYLSAPEVEQLFCEGVLVRCRPWNPNASTGRFTKKDFRINMKRGRVICPAGKTASIPRSLGVTFPKNDCATCQLKSRCTTAGNRTLKLHRHEDLLIKLRHDLATKPGREQLRVRVKVEHSLARVAAIQGPRARYKGARKNEFDLNRTAAVANLQHVARIRAAA